MLEKEKTELLLYLTDKFHKDLLEACLKNLEDEKNPLSFNNFCTGFRELIRHILEKLAPAQEIKECSWFKPDETSRSGITRTHAITYILQGGLSKSYVKDVLGVEISEPRKEINKAVNELSKYTHVGPKTFGTGIQQAQEKARQFLHSLTHLLTLAHQYHHELTTILEERIQDEVSLKTAIETIAAVDELATHYYVEDIGIEEIRIIEINHKYVEFYVTGNIYVKLQWGSNSDLRNDLGAYGNTSFPFNCSLHSSVDSPHEIFTNKNDLYVNTSSWWE